MTSPALRNRAALRPNEIMELYGFSRSAVYGWFRSGEFPVLKMTGGIAVETSEWEKFLDRKRIIRDPKRSTVGEVARQLLEEPTRKRAS